MIRRVLITEMDSSSVNAAASSAEKEYLFTAMPVNRAVISLAVPTVISQIITVVYNMADTFFIGQMNDPNQVAAATISMPLFIFMTALANLFGIGGASLISRSLGIGNRKKAASCSSFCIWTAAGAALLYGIAILFLRPSLLFQAHKKPSPFGNGRAHFLSVKESSVLLVFCLLSSEKRVFYCRQR